MNAQLLKKLSEAKAHLKKAALKMDVTLENDETDQYVYNAQMRALQAINSLDAALRDLEKGC